eukprot:9939286-Ditylum_brightwellii.AAC.1
MAKCLMMIMLELKMKQEDPIVIFEDNIVAIMMASASKADKRTRHIGISYFAIQKTGREMRYQKSTYQRYGQSFGPIYHGIGMDFTPMTCVKDDGTCGFQLPTYNIAGRMSA